jgi:Mrp family chromosome partitioning ATPase
VRILVYTGKGGVGKTSIAAATAVRCAARGERKCSSRYPMAAFDLRFRCRLPRAAMSACGRPATSSSFTSVRTDATSSCHAP